MLHNCQYFQHIIEDVFRFYNFDVNIRIYNFDVNIRIYNW